MKKCPNCARRFSGRANQVYCSLSCKTAVNNRIARERQRYASDIERQLRRSREALMRLTGDSSEVVVSRERLEREGYSFKHFTHQVKLKSGVLGNVQYDFAVFPEGEKFKVMYLYA